MTYRKFCFNILESLKQSTDDPKIEITQVLHWTFMAINNLNYEVYKKYKTSSLVNRYEINVDNSGDIKFVELPSSILNLEFDAGIQLVEYLPKKCNVIYPFSRTSIRSKWSLDGNPHTKPSKENPYWYRVGDKLELLGISCINIDKLWLYLLTAITELPDCDLDSELDIEPQYEETLFYRVRNLCEFGMISIEDRLNDGSVSIQSQQPPPGKERGIILDNQINQPNE